MNTPASPAIALRVRSRLRLAVAGRNLGSRPSLKLLERVAEIGLDACDNFDWRDPVEFGTYKEALKRFELAVGVLVVNKVPDVNALGCSLVSPTDRAGFLRELELCIAAAKELKCTRLEVLTGNTLPAVPKNVQMQSCVDTLKSALPLVEANGMMIVVEGLNTVVDHPGYFLDCVEDGAEMVRRVGSPHVKFLFDVYHVQIMQGNLIQRIRQNIDYIGQLHFADVPGRHEPGTGEINFRNVFQAIYDLGDRYDGHVTAEYEPSDATLQDLIHVRELASNF